MVESPKGVEAAGVDVGSGVGVGVGSGVLVGTEVGSVVAGAGATGVELGATGVGVGATGVGVGATGVGVGATGVGVGATGVGGKTEVGTARELGGAVINVGGGGPIEVGVKVENVDVSTVSTDEDSLVETLF